VKLSVVATLYCSAPYIEEFYRRTTIAAQELVGEDYEIVLVNDGSPDNSLDLTIGIAEKDPHLTLVDLSRNFGHHKAMMTGLMYSRGDRVFLIDSDLEEEPEWVIRFFEQMNRNDCDVVFGVQEQRKGGVFERWFGQWFYLLFRILTGLTMPANPVTARLMSRRYVNALIKHDEREPFLAGILHITGFDQRPQKINKGHSGDTTYTLWKKLALLVDAVTSFSNAPLIAIFYVGSAIALIACVYIVYIIFNRLLFQAPLSGWTSVIASIWLLGGLIISFTGVIGLYLSKVFLETKKRPYTIVRQIYGKNDSSRT